ncbi:DNA methyltransferase [Brachybacterium sp. HMSC06H03]|uniref:DNA-methyltransferase n=1 Tax=Brachybacterium sp. HMSC06H03 TaxID=1581127 RepID=UPI0008A30640|nr:DNA methyltransferase [Brachybacterium sp. HMSC06H03]OFT62592.1 DNA methyltransferase [Brachybacterium sp. HMSC06H03]
MSIYYQDDYVTLYHGDCTQHHFYEWMCADVLVTDPPYGIDYNSGSRRENLAPSIHGDKDTSLRDGVLSMWHERPYHEKPALVFGTWRVPRPSGTRALLVWDTKGALGMGDLSIPWKPSHQEIYVLGKGFAGKRSTDVLTYAPVQSMSRGGRVHPHQKPIPLMRDLIAKCPPGVIADPFAGSGSTLVAAKLLGRKAVGVEVDEAYCEIIAKRLDQGVLDLGGIA